MRGSDIRVSRVDFGYFVRPGSETSTGLHRVEPVLGYVVEHPQATLLVDTGMGGNREVDDHYRPRRRTLSEALAATGTPVAQVGLVVNSHLHFDHCGGNPELTGRPVFVQATELAAAHTEDYTLRDLIDAPGLVYEELSGEAEILPGVMVMPTPGHTDGHQSIVVRHGDGTVVVIAGQSHDTATDYSSDALALRAAEEGLAPPLPVPPKWMARLSDLDPSRVYFAHDHAVWTRDDAPVA